MKTNRNIEEIVRQKLEDFEVEVSPSVWQAISSQINPQLPAAAGGASMLKMGLIGLTLATVVSSIVWFSTNADRQPVEEKVKTSSTQERRATQNTTDLTSNEELSADQSEDSPRNQIKDELLTLENQKNPSEQTSHLVEDKKTNFSTDFQPLPTTEATATEDKTESIDVSPLKDIIEQVNSISAPESGKQDVLVNNESNIEYSFVLPNIFTPNGDGSNDVLSIAASGMSDFQLVILNSRNQVVFTSSDPLVEWNGLLFSGEPAPEGDYLYYFTARSTSGEAITKSNTLKLVR